MVERVQSNPFVAGNIKVAPRDHHGEGSAAWRPPWVFRRGEAGSGRERGWDEDGQREQAADINQAPSNKYRDIQ